jgi:hypothetical protein
MRKRRGVKAGLSDVIIWYRGRTVCVELKGPYGQCRPAQRLVREQMLRAGIKAWWQCRTAESAMWALRKSGIKFRVIVNDDGSTETWQQPELEPWEIPKTDPRERRRRPPHYWEPKVAVETQTSEPVVAADAAVAADIAAQKCWGGKGGYHQSVGGCLDRGRSPGASSRFRHPARSRFDAR